MQCRTRGYNFQSYLGAIPLKFSSFLSTNYTSFGANSLIIITIIIIIITINEMNGDLGHDSPLQGYTGPETTLAKQTNFVMNHAPGTGSIARSTCWPAVHRATTMLQMCPTIIIIMTTTTTPHSPLTVTRGAVCPGFTVPFRWVSLR